jgi:predicted TIM-barrel fold metal-dependent hydrolase
VSSVHPVVDIHCHAGRGDGLTAPWDTEARLDAHLARSARAGIDRTCVFPVFTSDYGAANERLARIVRSLAPRLVGFCAVHPRRDAGRVETMVGRAVEVYGFRGIKVHGHDALPGREVCEAARRFRVLLLVDVVRRVDRVEMLATQYPDVTFVIPHLGAFADDWAAQGHLVLLLRALPNVYADTSGVRYFELLRRAARTAPDKLVFGSDGPLLHPGVELYKVRQLGLGPAAERAVLGGTAARLLGLTPHGRRSVPDRADGARWARVPVTSVEPLGRPRA